MTSYEETNNSTTYPRQDKKPETHSFSIGSYVYKVLDAFLVASFIDVPYILYHAAQNIVVNTAISAISVKLSGKQIKLGSISNENAIGLSSTLFLGFLLSFSKYLVSGIIKQSCSDSGFLDETCDELTVITGAATSYEKQNFNALVTGSSVSVYEAIQVSINGALYPLDKKLQNVFNIEALNGLLGIAGNLLARPKTGDFISTMHQLGYPLGLGIELTKALSLAWFSDFTTSNCYVPISQAIDQSLFFPRNQTEIVNILTTSYGYTSTDYSIMFDGQTVYGSSVSESGQCLVTDIFLQ